MMKIVKLVTSQNVDVGGRMGAVQLIPGAASMPQGLKCEAATHPVLGPAVIVTTKALADQGRVSFVFPSNIVNLVVENDEAPTTKKGK